MISILIETNYHFASSVYLQHCLIVYFVSMISNSNEIIRVRGIVFKVTFNKFHLYPGGCLIVLITFHFQENFEYLNGTTNTYNQHPFMLNINWFSQKYFLFRSDSNTNNLFNVLVHNIFLISTLTLMKVYSNIQCARKVCKYHRRNLKP
jgi:hypothetical protein